MEPTTRNQETAQVGVKGSLTWVQPTGQRNGSHGVGSKNERTDNVFVIRARFNGECGICEGPISVGEKIPWYREVEHLRCSSRL